MSAGGARLTCDYLDSLSYLVTLYLILLLCYNSQGSRAKSPCRRKNWPTARTLASSRAFCLCGRITAPNQLRTGRQQKAACPQTYGPTSHRAPTGTPALAKRESARVLIAAPSENETVGHGQSYDSQYQIWQYPPFILAVKLSLPSNGGR